MESDSLVFAVDSAWSGARLDKFLAAMLESRCSRVAVRRAVESGEVIEETSGVALSPKRTVREGERYAARIPPKEPRPLLSPAPGLTLPVTYEDEWLAVINKPAGMTAHPGAGTGDDTVAHALLARYGEALPKGSGEDRPGIVHRLDRDTSGLMLVARTDRAHWLLSRMIAEREVKRTYLALCWGAPTPPSGVIDVPVGRHPTARTKMAAIATGRRAVTHYSTLCRYAGGAASLVECRLETGRTHQIRVHMQHRKCPLIGDKLYGGNRSATPKTLSDEARNACAAFGRQALHAAELCFTHPLTEEKMHFRCAPPKDMEELTASLATKEK
ncbi:MAG: RluA family pseudouridine synthase [Rickettsiales bacterium]